MSPGKDRVGPKASARGFPPNENQAEACDSRGWPVGSRRPSEQPNRGFHGCLLSSIACFTVNSFLPPVFWSILLRYYICTSSRGRVH
ncbi:hypothetical protein BO78DRAFT_37023 [Aspergillus sclerotiicarbonarius CBS 121057]|uniref:Uncharacterized protein n=1 Tax=Aspergillus sclerotiicarbonarius (strain CBS 121057 / IBT 28362) TaxID=1448318 RepID=A0A319EAF7_ASPSB|nr:hypothetical protein BO78DRAFT_37023 [Aspergillus sclerotiicarbonarius CBS 121057]